MSKDDYSADFNNGRYANRLTVLMDGVSDCITDADAFHANKYEVYALMKAKEWIYKAEHSYFIRHRVESKTERLERQKGAMGSEEFIDDGKGVMGNEGFS